MLPAIEVDLVGGLEVVAVGVAPNERRLVCWVRRHDLMAGLRGVFLRVLTRTGLAAAHVAAGQTNTQTGRVVAAFALVSAGPSRT